MAQTSKKLRAINRFINILWFASPTIVHVPWRCFALLVYTSIQLSCNFHAIICNSHAIIEGTLSAQHTEHAFNQILNVARVSTSLLFFTLRDLRVITDVIGSKSGFLKLPQIVTLEHHCSCIELLLEGFGSEEH